MEKVSIIVPIFNKEDYIESCLDSLLEQTLKDIEIICVNDASTDSSLELVKQRAIDDQRIKIINHKQNLGTGQARKHGVEAANGEYILFVDSDDSLEIETCEKLYEKIKKEKVDILHFGTNVIPSINTSREMVDWVEKFLSPYPQKLYGKDILEKCYVDGMFDFNITDKMWNAQLCKKSFSQLSNQKMIAAEDQYAFFVMAFYAESYLGIQGEKYYNYNLGIGITGGDVLDLKRFENRCTGAMVVQEVEAFLKRKEETEEYQKVFQSFSNKILWDCVDCWIHKLESNDSREGYRILTKYWEASKVVSAIARTNFESADFIKEKTGIFCDEGKGTIGIYYKDIKSKGQKRILENLKKKSSNVVLLVDEGSLYSTESAVIIPDAKNANWDKYENRAEAIRKAIQAYNIKSWLNMSPELHNAWLDNLLLKSYGVDLLKINVKKNLTFALKICFAKCHEKLKRITIRKK